MAKLVWQLEGQAPIAFAIRQERVAVGRDTSNDIRLAESAISSQHAVIITHMGSSTLHDLGSRNGSWVNGKRIESQLLRHGDVVQFGRLAMNFIDESFAATPQSGTDATQRDATKVIGSGAANPTNARGAIKAGMPPLPPGTPDFAELDRLIGSIRSHRNSGDQEVASQRAEMMAEWKKLMAYCTALKARLASEPRVRFFEISERRNEVVIRVEHTTGQSIQSVMLSWGHIEQRARGGDGIWLRAPPLPDRHYEKCDAAARDLVAAVAHLLA